MADDKAVYHYVPEMIRYYLGEEPILDNVPTWLLADPEQREYVLEHLDELVVKPTGESGGKGMFIGPLASEEQLEAPAAASLAEAPERWIAQQTVRAVHRPDRARRTARSRPATWTCARSPSSATRSRSCRAGSRAWRCARAR